MARRRRAVLDSEFAKPLLALALLGLLYLALQSGLLGAVATKLVGISAPKGETNAGAVYRREMAKR